MISENTLKINEIFFSIQGESTHAGKPCVFVRLTYCNLRCAYCDTEYAFYDGQDRRMDEILSDIRKYRCRTVEITGGEPLLQKPVFELMSRLCDEGFEVLLETGGSLDISAVDKRVLKIVDMKCPSSKMMHKNLLANLDRLLPHDELKFVIGTREDYDWALAVLRDHPVHKKIHAVLFSPVFGSIEPVGIVDWILADQIQEEIPNIRFQLQMHKFIWAPETHGV